MDMGLVGEVAWSESQNRGWLWAVNEMGNLNKIYENYATSKGKVPEDSVDPKTWFQARLPRVRLNIEKYIPTNSDTSVVDLGCGQGVYVWALGRLGLDDVVGVDVSSEQIAIARALGIEKVVEDDIEDFLCKRSDGDTDVVLAIDILEHIDTEHLLPILKEVNRILCPGGRFVVHVPNAGGIFGARVRYGDITHQLAFTRNSIKQLFRIAGFSRIDCYEERPVCNNVIGCLRKIYWILASMPIRLLYLAETGDASQIMSQNMTVVATA